MDRQQPCGLQTDCQDKGVLSPLTRKCQLLDAGQVSYQTGLVLQRKARALVEKEDWQGVLLLLEHEPVITIGRNGGLENLLADRSELRGRGIELVQTDRGGNITGHNPGQLVAYPILNLRHWQQDLHWYVRSIEEVVIRTLAHYRLPVCRKSGHPGVWVEEKKIAAIGVLVSRWITGHGVALNVNNDLGLFDAMIPCGIRSHGVTSVAQAGIGVGVKELKQVFAEEFGTLFQCRWDTPAALLPARLTGDQ